MLLVLTLVMGLTGYLLPFDQRSFWATVVAREHQRVRPDRRALPGRLPARRARSSAPPRLALLRDPHAARCPGLIAALIGAHLYLVAKLGTTAPPWLKAEKKDLAEEEI